MREFDRLQLAEYVKARRRGRCTERGCGFPAGDSGKCGQHQGDEDGIEATRAAYAALLDPPGEPNGTMMVQRSKPPLPGET